MFISIDVIVLSLATTNCILVTLTIIGEEASANGLASLIAEL
jgi:hypothetical protein